MFLNTIFGDNVEMVDPQEEFKGPAEDGSRENRSHGKWTDVKKQAKSSQVKGDRIFVIKRQFTNIFKLYPCVNMNENGCCQFGSDCHFAHHPDELRPYKMYTEKYMRDVFLPRNPEFKGYKFESEEEFAKKPKYSNKYENEQEPYKKKYDPYYAQNLKNKKTKSYY